MPILTSLTDELTSVVKFWMNLGSTAEVETARVAESTQRNLNRANNAINATSAAVNRLAASYRKSAEISALSAEFEAESARIRERARLATLNLRNEIEELSKFKGEQTTIEKKAEAVARIEHEILKDLDVARASYNLKIREAGEAQKREVAIMEQRIKIASGATDLELALADATSQKNAALDAGLKTSHETVVELQNLVEFLTVEVKKQKESTGARRSATAAVRDNTEALRKNIEAQRASAEAAFESARAERILATIPEGFLRQRAALLAEINALVKQGTQDRLADAEAEGMRQRALQEQIKTKEIELERLTEDRKAEIQRDANEKRENANRESLDKMREQQTASLALFEQTSAKASGELRGMNKELGATAGAVGQTAAQWQKYSMGQAKIGMAVAGSAAAIGAASTAFVDSEKEKAGILSAMHTAQAIALAFTPGGQAAAVAHAAAAAMFFGIATGAIKSASGGGGGGGGGGDAQATGASAGFTGGGEGGGEGRSINVTFGGGIVLGRPSDVAQAIAQAEFAARGQGRMGGGI
jgi:hypothetical protein